MRLIRRAAIGAAVAAAMAVTACGGGDDDSNADRYEGEEKKVAEVVDRLATAASEGDTKTICEDLVTAELQASVRETSGTSCAQEFEENVVAEDASFEVKSVDVRGEQATAVVVDQADRQSRLSFARVEGDWRIASIG